MPAIGLFYATGKSSAVRLMGSKKLEIEKSFLGSPKLHFSSSKGGFLPQGDQTPAFALFYAYGKFSAERSMRSKNLEIEK